MKYSIAQQSNQGGRDYNEDCTAIIERHNSLLLVVADGLGGHAGGGLASKTFVDALTQSFKKASEEQLDNGKDFLTLSINFAHHMIHRRAVNQGFPIDSPKTTCVVCLIHHGVALWAHSGDSRLYLIHRRSIISITEDHVTKKLNSKANSPINRCVGGENLPRPEVSEPHHLEEGDAFLLASDGAWHSFKVDDLRNYIDPEHPTLGLDSLLQELEQRNKTPSDNLSIALLFWEIDQYDKPTSSDFEEENSITLLSDPHFGKKKLEQTNTRTTFDIDNIDSTIIEIESFISDLDEKI